MTAFTMPSHRAAQGSRSNLMPRVAHSMATFGALIADSVRVARAYESAPTDEARREIADRFLNARTAA
jgi:hypothetical protein